MDPTDIVKVPYELERLFLYAGSVVAALFLLQPDQNTVKLPSLLLLTAVTYAVYILAGASLSRDLLHSMAAAFYTAALAWLDPPIFATTTTWNARQHWHLLIRGNSSSGSGSSSSQQQQSSATTGQDTVATCGAHCMASFLIPLQILLLYDAGWQVQRWPVPVIVASTYGSAVGVLAGTWWACVLIPAAARRQRTCRRTE